jgi:hypothetical protein
VKPNSNTKACIYCGSREDLTFDHIPPKLFLASPYPNNLITVPACLPCNQSFQKDDEYTRTVALLDVRASHNQDAQAKAPASMRSLQRPDARAFVEYLARQSTNTTILAHHGRPLGQIIDVDKVRVNATGARLVRGLHFVETGKPLSRSVVRVETKLGLRTDEKDSLEIARVFSGFPEWKNREFGTAFSYVAGFAPGMSVWLMLLYDYFVWLGVVDTRSRG